MTLQRPSPIADVESKPFWDGCAQDRLLLQRCTSCETVRYPPTKYCQTCNAPGVHWIESNGHGTVFSWIVVRTPIPRPMYEAQTPYVVALVTLDDGVRILTNIIDCAPEDVVAAMSVEVVFVEIEGGARLPMFRPSAQ